MPTGDKTFAPELATTICERIALGESLRTICRADDMPSEATVRSWAVENVSGFAAQYARARDHQADFYADEIIDIADTDEDPQRARLRVDARKWKASKLAPKRYGDRMDVTSGGEPIASYSDILRAERLERAGSVT
jgi:hypothetical protein